MSFTVFAPVNSAFDNLPAGTVAALLAEGNEEILDDLLKYHVVAGAAVTSDMLSNGQMVTTLEGGTLEIGVSGEGVTVNGASLITADIAGTNGVVHLIDGVLTETLDAVQRATITPDVSTLVTAVVAGGLVGRLAERVSVDLAPDIEVLVENDVDNASHGVRTVNRRGAIEQHFVLLDERARNQVDIR